MQLIAFALAVALIAPAAAAIVLRSRAAKQPGRGRGLERLWVALPLVGLALLVVLVAEAGA